MQNNLTIDNDVLHPDRNLPAIIISGAIGDLLRIKDDHVGRHAFP